MAGTGSRSGTRGRPVFGFLLLVLVAAALQSTDGASAAAPRRGATYRGPGSEPRWPASTGTNGRFLVQFRVMRSARSVVALHVWNLACRDPRTHGYYDVSPWAGSARIGRDGTFHAALRSTPRSPVRIAGRFTARGHARGTLSYRGHGVYRGCAADGVWSAHVLPPPPPVEHFSGTTEQGTRVTFDRTIEARPHVLHFSFGDLALDCGGFALVATGRQEVPPYDEFALRVSTGGFAGEFFPGGYFIDVAGHFDAADHASGTVLYGDRSDCHTGVVHWTAAP